MNKKPVATAKAVKKEFYKKARDIGVGAFLTNKNGEIIPVNLKKGGNNV